MRSPAPSDLSWRRSSRSGSGATTNCVELAAAPPLIAVRDSKHPDGAVLRLAPAGFRSLLRGLRSA